MNLGDLFHKFPIDKQAHFFAGVAISLAAGIISSPIIGLCAAVAMGLAKEVYDSVSETGTPDKFDFVATATGGALGSLWLMIVESFLK